MFQGKSVNESFNRFNFDHCVAPLTKLTPVFLTNLESEGTNGIQY